MSWIADYDTHGREFPMCVHVTKTTRGMTHGATYIPIQVSKDVRADNAKLRELVVDAWGNGHPDKSCGDCEILDECHAEIEEAHKKGNGRWNTRCLFERRIERRMRELGVEVDDG